MEYYKPRLPTQRLKKISFERVRKFRPTIWVIFKLPMTK